MELEQTHMKHEELNSKTAQKYCSLEETLIELETMNEQLKEQLILCQQELQFCQQDNTMLKVDAAKSKKKMEKLKK